MENNGRAPIDLRNSEIYQLIMCPANLEKISNLPISKKLLTYQLIFNKPTNTKAQQPEKYQLQKIVTYQLYKLHKTYQLEISKTCKLPTFFSESGGGPSPPWFPFIAALSIHAQEH